MANLPPNIPEETAQAPGALATQFPLVVNPPAFNRETQILNTLQQLQQAHQQLQQQVQQEHQQYQQEHRQLQQDYQQVFQHLRQEHQQLQNLVRGIETALSDIHGSCVFAILDSYGI